MFNKKSKRGFSLVELMVVVAIMGTLAAIAIPAYNEYRKSAKKSAYKADLTSLHKGWLAFGVELDSFCERETNPPNSSIKNVGMESLLSSKLYGGADLRECTGACADTNDRGIYNLPHTCGTGCTTGLISGSTNSPGKHNIIGFGEENCAGIPNEVPVQVRGKEGAVDTTLNADCDLNVSSYRMGVAGHISGDTFFGVSLNHNGVLSTEQEGIDSAVFLTAAGYCS